MQLLGRKNIRSTLVCTHLVSFESDEYVCKVAKTVNEARVVPQKEVSEALTNERWLRWAIARYYRSHDFKVSMKPVRVGNAMVDGVAIGPEGERIAIEVKSPRDDIVRGIGQCFEALAAGYTHAVLVTTLKVARKTKKRVFQRRGMKLIGVDAKAQVHRFDPDGWRLLR